MDQALIDLLQQNAFASKRVQIGNQSDEQHSLPELIKALRYLDGISNVGSPGALRRARVVNPGVGHDGEAD